MDLFRHHVAALRSLWHSGTAPHTDVVPPPRDPSSACPARRNAYTGAPPGRKRRVGTRTLARSTGVRVRAGWARSPSPAQYFAAQKSII